MMALRVTPVAEKEEVEVEGAEEECGIAKVTRSFVSTHGRFSRSWALLCPTKPVLMALMVVKKREEGMGM